MDHIGLKLVLVQIGSKFGLCELGLWAIWTTQTLGNLDLGQLEIWVICLLEGNLDFWQFGQHRLWVTWTLSNVDFGQFGQLRLWTPWVTWTLDSLGNLDFG